MFYIDKAYKRCLQENLTEKKNTNALIHVLERHLIDVSLRSLCQTSQINLLQMSSRRSFFNFQKKILLTFIDLFFPFLSKFCVLNVAFPFLKIMPIVLQLHFLVKIIYSVYVSAKRSLNLKYISNFAGHCLNREKRCLIFSSSLIRHSSVFSDGTFGRVVVV